MRIKRWSETRHTRIIPAFSARPSAVSVRCTRASYLYCSTQDTSAPRRCCSLTIMRSSSFAMTCDGMTSRTAISVAPAAIKTASGGRAPRSAHPGVRPVRGSSRSYESEPARVVMHDSEHRGARRVQRSRERARMRYGRGMLLTVTSVVVVSQPHSVPPPRRHARRGRVPDHPSRLAPLDVRVQRPAADGLALVAGDWQSGYRRASARTGGPLRVLIRIGTGGGATASCCLSRMVGRSRGRRLGTRSSEP